MTVYVGLCASQVGPSGELLKIFVITLPDFFDTPFSLSKTARHVQRTRLPKLLTNT